MVWKKESLIAVSIIQHGVYVSILNLGLGMVCETCSNTDETLSKQQPQ